MNAYELADDLEGWSDDWLSSGNKKNVFKKHAKMLRQQADYIKHLERGLESSITLNKAQLERLTNLSKNVDELEEELLKATHPNAKPVAWMFRGYLYEKDPSDWTVHEHPDVPVIPLYTHPAKTLTDEEIVNLYKETEADNGGIREFARAILKKASEK